LLVILEYVNDERSYERKKQIGCTETSAKNYHSTLHKIPKQRRPQVLSVLHYACP